MTLDNYRIEPGQTELRKYTIIRYQLNPLAFPTVPAQELDMNTYERFYPLSQQQKLDKFMTATINRKVTVFRDGTEHEEPMYNYVLRTFEIEVRCL